MRCRRRRHWEQEEDLLWLKQFRVSPPRRRRCRVPRCFPWSCQRMFHHQRHPRPSCSSAKNQLSEDDAVVSDPAVECPIFENTLESPIPTRNP